MFWPYPPGPQTGISSKWPHDPHVGECVQEVWEVDGVEMYSPFMIIIAGIGITTGLTAFAYIIRSKRMSKNMYALTYLFFAGMNTTGLLCHTFFPGVYRHGAWPPQSASGWFAYFDCACSTCTCLSFGFCGLYDVGLRKIKILNWLLPLSVYAGVWYGYSLAFGGKWDEGFHFLYDRCTTIGSATYLLCEIAWYISEGMVFSKQTFIMILGEVIGIVGLQQYESMSHRSWVCAELGPFLGDPEPVWYTHSDLGLISLLVAFLISHKEPGQSIGDSVNNEGFSRMADEEETELSRVRVVRGGGIVV